MKKRKMLQKRFAKPIIATTIVFSFIGGTALPTFGHSNNHSSVAYAAEYHGINNPIEGVSINVSKKNTPDNPAYPNVKDLKDNGVHVAYLSDSNAFVLYSDDYTGRIENGQSYILAGVDNGFYKVTMNIDTSSPTNSIPTVSQTKSSTVSKTTTAPKKTIATKVSTVKPVKVLYTGYATTPLNVRKTASAKGKKLGTLKKGDSVQVVTNGSWLKIKYKTGYAYVSKSYISKVKPTLYSGIVTTTSIVKSATGSKYKKLGTLKKGNKVSVVHADKSWVQIKYGSKYGYIKQSQMKKIIATGKLKSKQYVRSGAGSKYKKLGTLKKGTSVQIIKKGTWDQVVYKNGFGYILKSQIK
ncbi:SH3 domain-containing protein [Heyndrickxia ginsengihumi]|uniref:SH3 domain-containing protein n=1 Tax=Heyndrickxia ginsengihumi TaxID=363870 RepID=UPI00046F0A5D|nr:SH3 domain-containing protein [Heyndrickxia ginsengihumi]